MGATGPISASESGNYRIIDRPEFLVYENSARDLVATIDPEISDFVMESFGDETRISLSPPERSELPEYIVGYLVAPLRFDIETRIRGERALRQRVTIPVPSASDSASGARVEVYFEDRSPYDFMRQGKLRLIGVEPIIVDLE